MTSYSWCIFSNLDRDFEDQVFVHLPQMFSKLFEIATVLELILGSASENFYRMLFVPLMVISVLQTLSSCKKGDPGPGIVILHN